MLDSRLARWSRYLIYIVLATLPLERIPSLELTTPLSATVRISQIAGLMLILINVPLLWQNRRRLLDNPWRWLLVFWFACILSTGLATDLKRALSVTAFTVFAGLLAWVIALRLERARLHTYFTILIASALAACAFGFYQFFGDLLGLSTSWTGLRDQYTKDIFGFPRIQSTGLEPLYFGNYLLIPAALLVAALVARYRQITAALALVPIMAIVWLTVSRGAIIALAGIILIGLGAAAWHKRFRPAGLLLGGTAVSVALAFGLLYLGTHYFTTKPTPQTTQAIANFSKQTTNVSNGESSEGRAVSRELALKAFMSHPILGVGPGNFGSYASREMPERFSGNTGIVNNEPLEILAETGLLGGISFAAFMITLMWLALRSKLSDNWSSIWRYGLLAALVGIAVQYQTFSTLYITHIWVAIGLLAGLVALSDRRIPAANQA